MTPELFSIFLNILFVEEREKKEKKQGRYSGPGNAPLSFADDGSAKRLSYDKLGSLNRISSPASEYGTGKRKEVSWSDGVRARSHSPTNDDASRRRNRGGYEDPDYLKNLNQRDSYDPYSSLDRDRDRNSRSRERRSPSWGKPWIGNLGSKEDVSSSGKPWHSYLKDRENSPAYSSLQRHPVSAYKNNYYYCEFRMTITATKPESTSSKNWRKVAVMTQPSSTDTVTV